MFEIMFMRNRTSTLMVLITNTMQSPMTTMYGEAAGTALIGLIFPFMLLALFGARTESGSL